MVAVETGKMIQSETERAKAGLRSPTRVGYCLRCGGDCFDDGVNHYHKCPPKWPLADTVVAIKYACDAALQAVEARPWAKGLSENQYENLKASLRGLRAALDEVAPQGKILPLKR